MQLAPPPSGDTSQPSLFAEKKTIKTCLIHVSFFVAFLKTASDMFQPWIHTQIVLHLTHQCLHHTFIDCAQSTIRREIQLRRDWETKQSLCCLKIICAEESHHANSLTIMVSLEIAAGTHTFLRADGNVSSQCTSLFQLICLLCILITVFPFLSFHYQKVSSTSSAL